MLRACLSDRNFEEIEQVAVEEVPPASFQHLLYLTLAASPDRHRVVDHPHDDTLHGGSHVDHGLAAPSGESMALSLKEHQHWGEEGIGIWTLISDSTGDVCRPIIALRRLEIGETAMDGEGPRQQTLVGIGRASAL